MSPEKLPKTLLVYSYFWQVRGLVRRHVTLFMLLQLRNKRADSDHAHIHKCIIPSLEYSFILNSFTFSYIFLVYFFLLLLGLYSHFLIPKSIEMGRETFASLPRMPPVFYLQLHQDCGGEGI